MSKLPNAPLLEVIFELRWDVTNKSDIEDFQYLHGDLYSFLKDEYPIRKSLVPAEVPYEVTKGTARFRYSRSTGAYPLVQIGLGMISINTVDSTYYWESFQKEIKRVLNGFKDSYSKFKDINLVPSITYIDFFDLNKKQMSSIDFINKNLSINVNQGLEDFEDAKIDEVNFNLIYSIKKNKVLLNLRDGMLNGDKKGLILQTKMLGQKHKYSLDELESWLNMSHDLSSDIFKSLTKGKLYESFK